MKGITLDQAPSFRTWAETILDWLNEAMRDVAEGIGGDVATLLDKQQRYTAYAGALTEVYAQAEAYYKTALAEEMDKLVKDGVKASLVARLAEKEIGVEIRVYEAVKRLNTTLSDQLMAIASRLRYERSVNYGNMETPAVPF